VVQQNNYAYTRHLDDYTAVRSGETICIARSRLQSFDD